mgnify:CR=1 FL=1|jgi:hypothetical protein
MERKDQDPRNKPGRQAGPSYENPADQTPRREGGDDALAETDPTDSRADEKVIVNEQREHKTVNAPSQTAAHTSETESSDDEVF